jgi:molybdate transport system substrate-binding protein
MLAIAIAASAVAGCGGGPARSEVLVSAAASLTDAFAAIEAGFEAANPDIDVVLNLGGSSSLREQILAGAPADVFASANTSNMDAVVGAGETLQQPRVFATNRLEIAVPAGNPAAIGGLDDFTRADLLIGLCAAAAPCGEFAADVFDRAGVEPSIDTREPDVRALLTKIEAGELDAGIVYVTDVAAAVGGIEGIGIPVSANVVATYPIALLAGGSNSTDAAEFVAFVLSAEGQAILAQYGFGAP